MATKKSKSAIVFGLTENTAGALCYVLIWVSGLLFLLLYGSRRNRDL